MSFYIYFTRRQQSASVVVAPTEFILLETADTLLKEDGGKIGLE